MNFTHPLLLLLGAPLIGMTIVLARPRLRRLPRLRGRVTLVLRAVLLALLVAALAGPRATAVAAGVTVVFVLDRSGAAGEQAQQQGDRWVTQALQHRQANDHASVVEFGASASWSGPLPGIRLPTLPAIDGQATDIEAALRLALGTLPSNQPSRLVLLSSGRQTTGDALQAAQLAAAQGVPISTVQLPAGTAGVALTAVDLPPTSRAGDHDTLRVTVHAAQPTQAQLRLLVDGVPAGSQTVQLKGGTQTFLFAQTIPAEPGVHRYRVVVSAPSDTVSRNKTLDAVTVVQPAPRVLMLSARVSEAAPLAATLQRAGLGVQVVQAAVAQKSVEAFDTYDVLVLVDVPGSALSAATVTALHDAVYNLGKGLLVAGGPSSFTAGAYAASPLQQLLPVTSEAKAHAGRSNAGLVLIIDKSGSMGEAANGVTKISMAQQAAIDAVQHLQPNDQFGVLAFDDSTHVIVPFGMVGTRNQQAKTRQEILSLQPFGDTQIYPALRQAARWLFESSAPFKHIVLMTDGQGEPANYLPLIKLMRQNDISLSTIGIGADAETAELRSWAVAGNGRFYYTANPHDIPRLVVLETRLGSGPTQEVGTIGVHQATDSPALRSLSGQQLPPIGAYNITGARPNAQVILQSSLGDPILAQWQYGLGAVAVWTSGTATSWARTWLGLSGFWSDVVRGMIANMPGTEIQPQLTLNGNTLQIGADVQLPQSGFADLLTTQAEVTAPDGTITRIPLVQDAPGHYSGTFQGVRQGVYSVRIVQTDGASIVRQELSAVAVPYPAVYAPEAQDSTLLAAIAAADQAPVLQHPGDAFSATGLPAKQVSQDLWPWLVLLALLLFPLDVATRVLYVPPAPYDPRRGAAL